MTEGGNGRNLLRAQSGVQCDRSVKSNFDFTAEGEGRNGRNLRRAQSGVQCDSSGKSNFDCTTEGRSGRNPLRTHRGRGSHGAPLLLHALKNVFRMVLSSTVSNNIWPMLGR